MASQKKIVIAALAIASIMMIASVLALLTSTKTVPSSGTISAFKVTVYENDTTTLVITPFIFDSLGNGSSTYRDIFVKNAAGNKGMTLSMTTDTWVADPSNSSGPNLGVTLTWNYTSGVLTPGTGEGVRLTLSAADNAQTRTGLSFTVNINIIGTETT